jgi:hypothetical protein
VREAAVPPTPRRPTRPTLASKKRRLEDKGRRGYMDRSNSLYQFSTDHYGRTISAPQSNPVLPPRNRTQERNRAEARERLVDLVREAAVPPTPRRPTRPTSIEPGLAATQLLHVAAAALVLQPALLRGEGRAGRGWRTRAAAAT